jgi:hypothetical protein
MVELCQLVWDFEEMRHIFFPPSDAKFKPAAKHALAQPKTPAEGVIFCPWF